LRRYAAFAPSVASKLIDPMLNPDDTIEAFRQGTLDFDCTRMVLTQRKKKGGERFIGKGYIRQLHDGTLTFKLYVTRHNAKPLAHLEALVRTKAGEVHRDDLYYDLKATAPDGTQWTATRIMPEPSWDFRDGKDTSVIVGGKLNAIAAPLDRDFYKSKSKDYLRLHFFEEYDVSVLRMSEVQDTHGTHRVSDHAEFEACGAQFTVRRRKGSGTTSIEVTSGKKFTVGFDLRVQEALQYITAKTAMWRAKVTGARGGLRLELAIPWRKSSRTQFDPPISPVSEDFHRHTWKLFGNYLEYVAKHTKGTHWNPVAYHLYNACEATGNSLDAWAVGVSVAVEAVASLAILRGERKKAAQIARIQTAMRKWLAEQSFPEDHVNRVAGFIIALGDKRPQDTMYELAKTGRVEKSYIKAWQHLRNRHVHPKLKDLKKPLPNDYQKLIDDIHRTEVLLRQLTFFLIEYEGPFTDYGIHGGQVFPSKQYPLRVA
jgi:hypothetical protein